MYDEFIEEIRELLKNRLDTRASIRFVLNYLNPDFRSRLQLSCAGLIKPGWETWLRAAALWDAYTELDVFLATLWERTQRITPEWLDVRSIHTRQQFERVTAEVFSVQTRLGEVLAREEQKVRTIPTSLISQHNSRDGEIAVNYRQAVASFAVFSRDHPEGWSPYALDVKGQVARQLCTLYYDAPSWAEVEPILREVQRIIGLLNYPTNKGD